MSRQESRNPLAPAPFKDDRYHVRLATRPYIPITDYRDIPRTWPTLFAEMSNKAEVTIQPDPAESIHGWSKLSSHLERHSPECFISVLHRNVKACGCGARLIPATFLVC